MQVHILAQSVVSVSALEGVAKEMELKNSDYVELKSSIVQPEMLNELTPVVEVSTEFIPLFTASS